MHLTKNALAFSGGEILFNFLRQLKRQVLPLKYLSRWSFTALFMNRRFLSTESTCKNQKVFVLTDNYDKNTKIRKRVLSQY